MFQHSSLTDTFNALLMLLIEKNAALNAQTNKKISPLTRLNETKQTRRHLPSMEFVTSNLVTQQLLQYADASPISELLYRRVTKM